MSDARVDADHRTDVIVVGDGPAGSALAAACARRGADVALVGHDRRWSATYGAWLDELEGVEGLGDVESVVQPVNSIRVCGERCHELERRYGVVDNGILRSRLRESVNHVAGHVVSTRLGVTHHSVALEDGSRVRCRLIVLATGPAGSLAGGAPGPAWQTAYGAVLDEPPPGELGRPTLMDFRKGDPAGGAGWPPTFLYAVPVDDGWLVEETVLAARPAVEPQELAPRLAARLGRTVDELRSTAVRIEEVAIPMGGPLPDRRSPIVSFGAAAGYVHPATGFSVAASLRAAPRVAEAVVRALAAPADLAADPRPVWDAVWPRRALRTRALHDYGLERMVRFDQAELGDFFDRFFDLSADDWAAYLCVDAAPAQVSRAMGRLFRSASPAMRRRLATGNPLTLARALRR